MPSLRPPYNHHNRYGINCVVYANGQYSQEVTVYLFASRLRPGTPGWDSRALEIDEDEDDSKTDESVEVIEDVLAE